MSSDLKSWAASALVASLDQHPDDWEWKYPDKVYLIRHRSNPIELWVGNGAAHVYQPQEMNFGFYQYLRLRRAFKRWKRAKGNKTKSDAEETLCAQIVNWLAK